MISILLAIVAGLVLYYGILREYFVNTCLIRPWECIRIEYTHKDNTVLVYEKDSGNYVWFDGRDILLYGEPTGRVCDDPYESVYVWDLVQNKAKGYACAKPIDEVKDIYEQYPTQYISLKYPGTLSITDLVNALISRGIIQLP